MKGGLRVFVRVKTSPGLLGVNRWLRRRRRENMGVSGHGKQIQKKTRRDIILSVL